MANRNTAAARSAQIIPFPVTHKRQHPQRTFSAEFSDGMLAGLRMAAALAARGLLQKSRVRAD